MKDVGGHTCQDKEPPAAAAAAAAAPSACSSSGGGGIRANIHTGHPPPTSGWFKHAVMEKWRNQTGGICTRADDMLAMLGGQQ
jgi:hypothetical protein